MSYCYEYCPLCGLENVHIFSAPVFFSTRLLAAMYDIGNSWCEAELNTVLAVVVLPPPRWLLAAGFVRLNSAIFPAHPAGGLKDAGATPASFEPPCGCVRQIAEFSRTKPAASSAISPQVRFACLFRNPTHSALWYSPWQCEVGTAVNCKPPSTSHGEW